MLPATTTAESQRSSGENVMAATTRRIAGWVLAAAVGAFGFAAQAGAQSLELRYGHMNPPTSAAGIQAQMLAEAIAKNTNGQIKVTVYPSSQLGKLQEL